MTVELVQANASTPTPRRPRKRPDDRKERILEVAAEMFATQGYSSTGVDEIGEAVGVTGPAIYRHFANKQSILDEICVTSIRVLLEDTRKIVAERMSSEDTLAGLVQMQVAFSFGPFRDSFAIMHARDTKLSAKADRTAKAMRDLYRAEWLRVLGDIRPAASTVELHVAWYAAHMLVGYSEGIEQVRTEDEHKEHLQRMALAVLLA